MRICAPPKRFEDPSDPKYDQIRHRPWFRLLLKVRAKIPMLEMARRELAEGAISQQDVCEKWNVPSRQLRDYVAFVYGKSKIPEDKVNLTKDIIRRAYVSYCHDMADKNLTHYIAFHARILDLNPRRFVEDWEIDPTIRV
jgi:hypothetical protein